MPTACTASLACQSFRSKPRQRIDHYRLAERDLILDDNMDGRMKRQLRDSDAVPTRVGLDKSNALGLVDREPLAR
jgi:hypothetical protein